MGLVGFWALVVGSGLWLGLFVYLCLKTTRTIYVFSENGGVEIVTVPK